MKTFGLIEETQDLSTGLLGTSLLVGHDTESSGEDKVSEATGRQDVLHPLLNATEVDVKSGRDDSAFINSANKVNYDFSGSMVVDNLELADVA